MTLPYDPQGHRAEREADSAMRLEKSREQNDCGGYYCSEEHGHIDCQLTDTDPMPFGKYKGTPMQDVPASYLHWLWSNGKKSDHIDKVAIYIRRNLNALKTEHPDGLWT